MSRRKVDPFIAALEFIESGPPDQIATLATMARRACLRRGINPAGVKATRSNRKPKAAPVDLGAPLTSEHGA